MKKHLKVDYIQCGWRRAWIMWDLSNGHSRGGSDPGIGYMWVFKTRREALEHRKEQHKDYYNARLSRPILIKYD